MNIIDHILSENVEGGYVNDPDDPGGETKFGISKRSYPDEDIPNLTIERARFLLERDYIIRPGFDKLAPSCLRDQLIDFGYNSGPETAILRLQGILKLRMDGVLGPRTLSAIRAYPDILRLNNELVKARMMFLVRLVQKRPKSLKYLAGWTDRTLSFLV